MKKFSYLCIKEINKAKDYGLQTDILPVAQHHSHRDAYNARKSKGLRQLTQES